MKCQEAGCRSLQTTCTDCGRVVITREFSPPGEWISVKDRLPGCDLGVFLIYVPKQDFAFDGVFTAYWENGRFQDNPSNCGCTGFGKVSHWMPLPEPPKKQ